MKNQRSNQSGFTLIEIVLAVTLLSIVAIKAHGAMQSASKSMTSETQQAFIEDQVRRVLRQVGFAVMGSSRESLMPTLSAPFSTDDINFRVNLGIQDGAVVWSDPEKVAMDHDDLNVYWAQNPTAVDERRVNWTNLVAPYLEGEIPNGIDDNGNGVIDETGLNFVINGDSVTIRLTLQRVLEDGTVVEYTQSSTVTCRNLGQTP